MDNFLSNFLSYLAPDEGDVFFLFWAKQALISIAILVVFYLLSKLLRLVLGRLGVRYTTVSGHDLVERMLQRISEPAALLTNCAGLYLMIRRLPLPERLPAIAAGVVFIVNVGIVTDIVSRVLDELLKHYGSRLSPDMSRQLIPLIQKIGSIFLFGTALVITLKHFNYDILSLVTALGVGSLAIGLAAKDTLANMISGFTLMIDRPFRIGDRISLRGQVGDVIDVGLRSTKIKSGDNTFMVVPNSELCNSTVVNMAFPDNKVTGRINVVVAYGTDVENAKVVLAGSATSIPGVLTDPAPQAFFTSFGDNGLELALIFWVSDYNQLFSVTDRINCGIVSSFGKNGINIPYPTRTVFLEKDAINATQD